MALKPVKLGSMSPGVNNRLEQTELGVTLADRSRATFLYAGENIDINGKGHVRRRPGVTRRLDAAGCHSLWGDATDGYAVVEGVLTHLQPPDLAQIPLVADMPPLAVGYVRAPDGWVYWSNGIRSGRLRGIESRALITPTPASAPSVSVVAGALPPGRYQVAFTADGPDGESAATPPVQVDLPDGGGLAFGGLATGIRVYVTGPNGEIFNELAGGAYLALSNSGARIATMLLAPMPHGHTLAVYGGSLLVAAGPYVFVSEPYRYGLYNPSRGYIPFPAAVTVVQPCEDGVFVCADRTYWLAGDILDTQAVTVLPFGGLRGSSGFAKDQNLAYWQSPRGIVLGSPGGTVATPQDDALVFGAAAAGATLFRERDGARHLVAARLQSGPLLTAARSYPSAESTRKETVL